jgi:hypothetical protein
MGKERMRVFRAIRGRIAADSGNVEVHLGDLVRDMGFFKRAETARRMLHLRLQRWTMRHQTAESAPGPWVPVLGLGQWMTEAIDACCPAQLYRVQRYSFAALGRAADRFARAETPGE